MRAPCSGLLGGSHPPWGPHVLATVHPELFPCPPPGCVKAGFVLFSMSRVERGLAVGSAALRRNSGQGWSVAVPGAGYPCPIPVPPAISWLVT